MTRCVIYARVSSEEQAGPDKTSIQTQLDDCRQLAAKLGWSVVGEFVDDRRYRVGRKLIEPSGTRADRPAWRRMLAWLADGKADALLAWHSSRLYRAYRPMIDMLDVLDAHPAIRVELVKETFNKDTAILYAWVGKKENESRTERVIFGLAGRARKGLAPTGNSKLFRPIFEPGTGERLGYEFNPAFRPVLDEMARLFLAGYTYHGIARALGAHPVTGRPWSRMSVVGTLTNPLYRGRIEYGKSRGAIRFTVQADRYAIWDATTCRALEAELARRKHLGSPHSLIPFSGILHCGYCGRQMSGHTQSRQGQPWGRPYRMYMCQWRYRARIGDVAETPHAPNTVAEHRLIVLLEEELANLAALDIDHVLGIITSLALSVTPDHTEARARLLSLETQTAEIESDIGHVRAPAARAALETELSRLRQEAALYRSQIDDQTDQPVADWDRLRADWSAALADPDPFNYPDPQLRARLVALFPALYYADGKFGRLA